MRKYDVEKNNPERYALVHPLQEKMRGSFETKTQMQVFCPYCGHLVQTFEKGRHDGNRIQCKKCGNEFYMPPVSFYRNNSRTATAGNADNTSE